MKRFSSLLLAALLLGSAAQAAPALQASVVFAQASTQQMAGKADLRAVERALDSVVSISTLQPTTRSGSTSRGWSPFPGTLLPWLGTGTGVIVSAEGDVLTSYRLVQGNQTVNVRLRGGQTSTARVMGTAPEQDLALVRIEKLAGPFRPVTLGNSAQVTAGQKLIALGLSAQGGFDAQEVGVQQVTRGSNEITLDTALNAQLRGGPLLNADGEVVALASGRFGARLDLPFIAGSAGAATPINAAKALLPELRAGRNSRDEQRPRLGVRFVDLSNFTVRQLRAHDLPSEGMLIQEVEPGSPADRAGLRGGTRTVRLGHTDVKIGGDVITAIEGQPVRSAEELQRAIRAKAAGTSVRLEVRRGDQARDVTITLGEGSPGASGLQNGL